MPWIRQIQIGKATGLLKKELDAAKHRGGRVWNIVHIMSLNPQVLKASMRHYQAIMFGDSPLSRMQREIIATVVSLELNCHY